MAKSSRLLEKKVPDLSTLHDIQLLKALADSAREDSAIQPIALEMMSRYTSHLEEKELPQQKDYTSLLGEARWGDASRVESIFGMKRGLLGNLANAGSIESKSLKINDTIDGAKKPARAKRLYNLVSIAKFLESND